MHSIEQQVALKSARLNTIPADWHLGSVGNDCYILNNLRMPISEARLCPIMRHSRALQ